MVGKYTNTMKKVHKIGKHGAFLLITQQGEICLECGKRVNNRGTNPRGTDGRFTKTEDNVQKFPIHTVKFADMSPKLIAKILRSHGEKLNEIVDYMKILEQEVAHLKRNVYYDCPVCNKNKVSRWHDHEKDEI